MTKLSQSYTWLENADQQHLHKHASRTGNYASLTTRQVEDTFTLVKSYLLYSELIFTRSQVISHSEFHSLSFGPVYKPICEKWALERNFQRCLRDWRAVAGWRWRRCRVVWRSIVVCGSVGYCGSAGVSAGGPRTNEQMSAFHTWT